MQLSVANEGQATPRKKRNQTMSPEESQQLKDWLSDIAVHRDKAAFSHIFKWFAPKIIRFGIKQLNTEAAANELLQDTMSNVWRKSHLFDSDKGAATTWVYTIMRNVSFDMLRKVRSQREDFLSDDIWPIVEAENVEEEVFNDHLMEGQIAQYLELLPEAQKQVIQGVYFQELSQEQLAEQLNIPLGTVKSRLRLALNKLKQQLGDIQ
ncbi:RNA polymerase sigma-70 factor, ECF subfamily [Pseudoalteromonas ulvae UL12]|uniref:RNA polymerase subunit sigma n=1 Tax=Pseudoalteromonas ulvae TaxID=107327 RepID=A0A244CRE7_PSEDV|nr:sigma-70 family RNA polymerase sigma factor [Pseudoalteromonas ulvae]MBE0366134.1 RNA polymerase sigma-70 factor, ECF subfamily [Pseudoalteromonas ulvae UL12]OUL58148.1 RNA polymerase subunit sigma [Pseudoalteromonas ulvae]